MLHRVLGPSNQAAWRAIWRAGTFDGAALDAYWEQWRPRFGLFDAEHPFYQVASLGEEHAAPISRLAHEMASGNNATLFDHTLDDAAPALSAADAAGYLVAAQAFALAGRITSEKGQGEHGAADAAPLARGAVCLMKGGSLFETLALNLTAYSPVDDQPFPAAGDDRPAWERDAPTRPQDRPVTGYLDLLTWQSRRVRLLPGIGPDGDLVVRRAVVMKGEQFPDRSLYPRQETMLAFRANRNAKSDQDAWFVVGFDPDRALWRDSVSLMQSLDGVRQRPRTLDWTARFLGREIDRARLPVDTYGLLPDKAKVEMWRHERLTVPAAYLADEELVDQLDTALRAAEEVGRLFQARRAKSEDWASPAWVLGRLLTRSDQPPQVDAAVAPLGLGRRYWSRLDLPFRHLLLELPTDPAGEQQRWSRVVVAAARRALDDALASLDADARSLEAGVHARAALRRHLRRLVPTAFGGDTATTEATPSSEATPPTGKGDAA